MPALTIKNLSYQVVIRKNEEGNGDGAYCPDLPGCNSIGETLSELKRNIQEAIIGYLEVLRSLQKTIPVPQKDSVYLETIAVSI
ncbi:MAG: type II toxin-antitoxin system HicB family antitoxin [candidate division KSB1 bacterium]|nr:type II toxin-antitoxin system HicB family antitoxin [candidate division KSB1 bacterium]MDZ7304903.1 type II toxin-antitoxin system HicB family antitoxin [candidate division KSB1 bacterium]MDZ7313961.1 type II toxin-antitoxin system HicB family antitoxin [candidate division KSB1 bacterium]